MLPMSDKPPDETGALPVAQALPKSKKTLSRVKLELSDDELSSPGVSKMLVGEIERLGEECEALVVFRDRYYVTDRKLAVVSEQLNKSHAGEIVLTGCFTLGGAALGYVPAIWSTQPVGAIVLIFGVVLMVVGVAARHILR